MANQFGGAVIGAGPAGAAAAKYCAEKGLKTILIEKCRLPRPKPCGGLISLKAQRLIGEEIPWELIDQQVRGFRFFSKTLDSVEVKCDSPVAISTTRDKFDAFLTDLAVNAGCTLIQSNGVNDISRQKDEISCRLADNQTIRAQLVIGADGVNSTVAQKSGIRQGWRNSEVALCLETCTPLQETEMKKLNPEIPELYFTDTLTGYGWLFPKRASAYLGMGGFLSRLSKPMEILAYFRDLISKTKNVSLSLSNVQAHLVPAGGYDRKIVDERVMLVGDAAGFADSLSGEGIYYAIRSGQLAGAACLKAMEKNNFRANFLEKQYADACNDCFVKDLKVALKLTYRLHKHFDLFFSTLQEGLGAYWIDLVTGAIDYRGLQRKLFPKLAVNLFKEELKGRNKHNTVVCPQV